MSKGSDSKVPREEEAPDFLRRKKILAGSKHFSAPEIDNEKIDETILALLYLALDDNGRSWKTFEWSSLRRLHEKGFISDPANKAKSVLLTDKGLIESQRLFEAKFAAEKRGRKK